MTIQTKIIQLARKHLGTGTMQSSAKLCYDDAVSLYDRRNFPDSRHRALKSLEYSIGRAHADYQQAAKLVEKLDRSSFASRKR